MAALQANLALLKLHVLSKLDIVGFLKAVVAAIGVDLSLVCTILTHS